jgi:hypothetical protein
MAQHYGAARAYMKGLAEKARVRSFSVVRLNQRTCGGTEHLHDGYWAERRTVEFAHEHARESAGERREAATETRDTPERPAVSRGMSRRKRGRMLPIEIASRRDGVTGGPGNRE